MMYVQDWLLPLLWVLWFATFLVLRPRKRGEVVQRVRRARWGILLQTLGYWAIFIPARPMFLQPLATWRVVAGTATGAIGIVTAATAIRHLSKQWRVDAGLNADHELVRTGPYRFMRHPIYASMLDMFITSVLFIGYLPWWPIGLAIFLLGIEIRVQIEDGLLRGRFGDTFEAWKREVPAYLPPVR